MDLFLPNDFVLNTGPVVFDTHGSTVELIAAGASQERAGRKGEAEMLRITRTDGSRPEEFRLKDYERLYAIPGLYREVVQRRLKCQSPDRVAFSLVHAVTRSGQRASDLKVLDVAAGDGFSSSALYRRGANEIVGTDYIEVARTAAQREHPQLYPAGQTNYLVKDISRPDHIADIAKVIKDRGLTAMSCSGALGHLPLIGFLELWESFPVGSYLSASFYDALDEQILPIEEDTQFTNYLRSEIAAGRLELLDQARFDHRFAMDGSKFRGALAVVRKISE